MSASIIVSPAPAVQASLWRDPLLPHMELRQASRSRACYVPHRHDSYSIGAVDDGNSRFTGARGGPVNTARGTLVLVPPEQVHACNPADLTHWSYHMLHVDVAWVAALREEHRATDAQPRLGRLDHVRLLAHAHHYTAYHRLSAVLRAPYGPEHKQAALMALVMDFDTDDGLAALPALGQQPSSAGLRRALTRLHDAPAAAISLATLAADADMGKYQLIRAFRACTGMTPHAYQLDLRIRQARRWLRQGRDLASVAYGLGFADQSHFQRLFKARTAMTPGRYRQAD